MIGVRVLHVGNQLLHPTVLVRVGINLVPRDDVAGLGIKAVEIVAVHFHGDADLMEVGDALRGVRAFLGRGKRGQKQRGQYRDDCNDHEQFDQRERCAAADVYDK